MSRLAQYSYGSIKILILKHFLKHKIAQNVWDSSFGGWRYSTGFVSVHEELGPGSHMVSCTSVCFLLKARGFPWLVYSSSQACGQTKITSRLVENVCTPSRRKHDNVLVRCVAIFSVDNYVFFLCVLLVEVLRIFLPYVNLE